MTHRILAELKPDPNAILTLYTVPNSNVGVGGQVLVVNQGNPLYPDYDNSSDYVSIALAPIGGSSLASYIAFNTFIPPGHTAQWQEIGLAAGESIVVQSHRGQCSFVFTGVSYD